MAKIRAFSIALASVAERLGTSLDDRGLVPLAAARALLKKTKVYERDGGDEVWGSLLSLADAKEFCREASRLEWKFPFLRGWDNEDAVIRYGAGVLPWLSAMLDRTGGVVGSMPPVPFYFVGTHLIALGPAALPEVLRVKRDEDPDGLGFVSAWLERHGAPAWKALAKALEGRRVLDALAQRSPRIVVQQLNKALGTSEALKVLSASSEAPERERKPPRKRGRHRTK